MRGTQPTPRRLATALLAGACLVAWFPAHGQTPVSQPADGESGGSQVDRRSLIEPGESPDLFVLYTGDVIGYLDPCG